MPLLAEVLARAIPALSGEGEEARGAAELAANALRTFAGLGVYDAGRAEVLKRWGVVCDIVRGCGEGKHPAVADAAVACVGALAGSPGLQAALVAAGASWVLIPLLFAYDAGAGGDGADVAAAERMLSLRARGVQGAGAVGDGEGEGEVDGAENPALVLGALGAQRASMQVRVMGVGGVGCVWVCVWGGWVRVSMQVRGRGRWGVCGVWMRAQWV